MTLIKPATILALFAACLFVYTPAHAGPITERAVKTWIEDDHSLGPRALGTQPYNAGKLHGYISGMADAMAVTKTFCPPPGLHQKDLLVLVEKYLVRDVANQDAPASPRIMQLLRQTYPCSGGNRKNAPAKKGQDT